MSKESDAPSGVPGEVSIDIPFPKKGPWMLEGAPHDLGIIEQGLARVNLYKSANNRLHIYAQFVTWGDRFIKKDIPLSVPDVGVSTLGIRWEDKKVVLWQDSLPAIELDWQSPA